jgi:hypothetical protein
MNTLKAELSCFHLSSSSQVYKYILTILEDSKPHFQEHKEISGTSQALGEGAHLPTQSVQERNATKFSHWQPE